VRIIIECPERILHLEAGYIYADCTFAQLQTSCSSVADHTLSVMGIHRQLRPKPDLLKRTSYRRERVVRIASD
jgi:hypothetical protein